MIAWMAALALQTAAPADETTTFVLEALEACGEESRRDGEPGFSNMRAADGTTAWAREGAGLCQIVVSRWTPDGERLALDVERTLAGWTPGFRRDDWRKPVVNEFGPTVWSTFDQLGPDGALTGRVMVVEPADGAAGELSITYQAARP